MPTYTHKPRTYLHFDPPPSAERAEALATDPQRVARHAFYPFLGFTVTTPKVQKDENGAFVRKDKERPIKLAAHLDAAVYSHYARILAEGYEAEVAARGIDDCVIAFRRPRAIGRNNIFFAHEAFEFIKTHRPCVALRLDIEKFFDRLDHAHLKLRWAQTLGVTRLPSDHFNVFKSLTGFRWVDRAKAFRAVNISPHNPKPRGMNHTRICDPETFRAKIRGRRLILENPEEAKQRGIPQGAPISALLSNLYMLEFDTIMQRTVSACGGLYRRYCDDIMVVAPPEQIARIETLATAEILKLKLEINPQKTTRARFPSEPNLPAEGGARIQYLGFDFDGRRKLIRASSFGRYYGKMRAGAHLALLCLRKQNLREMQCGVPLSGLKTRQLYIRYSYLIRRRFRRKRTGHERQNENFITYAYRAANAMIAPEIRSQIRNHLPKLKVEIAKALR